MLDLYDKNKAWQKARVGCEIEENETNILLDVPSKQCTEGQALFTGNRNRQSRGVLSDKIDRKTKGRLPYSSLCHTLFCDVSESQMIFFVKTLQNNSAYNPTIKSIENSTMPADVT